MLNRTQQIGFTLLELMIIVAILGILTALAAPSFTSLLERRKIIASAEAIQSDLRWARGEAIKRNKQVAVIFVTDSPWSYAIYDNPYGSYTLLKTVDGSDFPSTTLSAASFAGGTSYTIFNPARGTGSAGTVKLTSTSGEVHVVLSLLGRARICSVDGNIGGYATC